MSIATVAWATTIPGKDWVPLVWVKPIGCPIGASLSKNEETAIASSWRQITLRRSETETHQKLTQARKWLSFCESLVPSVQAKISIPRLNFSSPLKYDLKREKEKEKEPSLSSYSKSSSSPPSPSIKKQPPSLLTSPSPGRLMGPTKKYTPSPPQLSTLAKSLPATPLLTPPPLPTCSSATTPTLQPTPSPASSLTPITPLPPPAAQAQTVPIPPEKSPLLLAVLIDQFVQTFEKKYRIDETFQGAEKAQCFSIFALFEAVMNPQKKEDRELAKPFHVFRLTLPKWMHIHNSMIGALKSTLGQDDLLISSWSHGIHSLFSRVSHFIKVPPPPVLVFAPLDPPLPPSICGACVIL